MITAYPIGATPNAWVSDRAGNSPNWPTTTATNFNNRATEYNELRDLTDFLARTYPMKKFILLNWEGDNALHMAMSAWPSAGNASAVDKLYANYTDWLNNRASAVKAAPHHSNVKFGVEFNMSWRAILRQPIVVFSTKSPSPSTGPQGDCTSMSVAKSFLNDVFPNLKLSNIDYLSHSAYESFEPPHKWEPEFGRRGYDDQGNDFSCPSPARQAQSDALLYNGPVVNYPARHVVFDAPNSLRTVLDYLKIKHTLFTPINLILGEYGFSNCRFHNPNDPYCQFYLETSYEGLKCDDVYGCGIPVTRAAKRVLNTAIMAGVDETVFFQLADSDADQDSGRFGIFEDSGVPKWGRLLECFFKRAVFLNSDSTCWDPATFNY